MTYSYDLKIKISGIIKSKKFTDTEIACLKSEKMILNR